MTTGPTAGRYSTGQYTSGTRGTRSAFAALWAALRLQRRPGSPGIGQQLSALPRLVSSVLKGRYPGMDKSRLLMMAAALAYIVSPIDLVPESMFFLLGLGDDAFVLSWLAGSILAETEAFLDWEGDPSAEQPASERVVRSQVV